MIEHMLVCSLDSCQTRLGHGPRLSATGSHVPTQYDKTPCMFSQRAMAYWLEACAGHVGQVSLHE